MKNEVIDRAQLKQLQAVFEMGFNRCAVEAGLLKPYLSLSEAKRKYGPKVVQEWIDSDIIHVQKDGERNCKCRIKRSELELAAVTSNRSVWFDRHK